MAPDPITGFVGYIDVDSVSYDFVAPWPTMPHGSGPSLARISPLSTGDEPLNWQAGPTNGTPGARNLPNTNPTVNAFTGGTINEGSAFNSNGSFTDPDFDPDSSWTATVNYGDGTGTVPLTLTGHNFNLSHIYADNVPPGASAQYTVTVSVTDIAGASNSTMSQVTVNNVPPTLTLSGDPTAALNGPYLLNLSSSDPGQDSISSWTINWGDGPAQIVNGNPALVSHTYTATGPYTISATATDEDGTYSAASVSINVVPSSLVTRHYLFYNNSYWDDPARGFNDDNAIDSSKAALLGGQTATFANYSGSSLGINGIMVDISGLPAGNGLGAADFSFKVGNNSTPSGWSSTVPAPTVLVRRGAGTGGTDRVELIWADNAIQDTWLQVTVKADSLTGLSSPHVFYYGNQIGETGNDPANTFVDAGDFVAVRDHPANFLNRAQPSNPYDFNHDSFVDGADLVITRDNPNNFLTAIKLISPPVSAPSMPAIVSASAASKPAVASASTTSSPASMVQPVIAPYQVAHPTTFSGSPVFPNVTTVNQTSRPRKRPWWA